jgi:hypothetical protein
MHHLEIGRWHKVQLARFTQLTELIIDYRTATGKNPETLDKLFEALEDADIQRAQLKFRQSPTSTPEEWLYFPKGSVQGWILSSPYPLLPWPGSSGHYLISRLDGGWELIPQSKWKPPTPSPTAH